MKYFYCTLLALVMMSYFKYVPSPSNKWVSGGFVSISSGKTFEDTLPFDSTVVVNLNNKVLLQLYRAVGFTRVWQDARTRKAMLIAIRTSDNEGLFPEDYQLQFLEALEHKYVNLDDHELLEYDIALTVNAQLFLLHLKNGKLDPKKLYNDWDVGKAPFDVNLLLLEAFRSNDIAKLVVKCRPDAPVYHQLVKALYLIRQFKQVRFPPIKYTKNIMLNEATVDVKAIKKRLRYWGDLKKSDSLSSRYDVKMFAAVKRFQRRHGLLQDGVIGLGTIEALNCTRAMREQQIIANLERWRWFEEQNKEAAVFVNIPDYKLMVIENRDTTIIRKIVVGSIKRKTPVLNSYLKTIVLNPTWTIPPTIIKEDVVPAMLKNRRYLSNKKIVIFNNANEVVSPERWNPATPHAYRYVQGPGPENTLGVMKILFPNRHSVYLHDTNHRNGFGLSNRSLSSGCIRVEKPLQVVNYFLSNSAHWSKKKTDSVIATGKTLNLKIEKKYHLYLYYWTAWSDKGMLHFRKDSYGYDAPLYASLRRK
ncbi:MAG: L,D-transpeptidase family protein [Flavobacterium sp.]